MCQRREQLLPPVPETWLIGCDHRRGTGQLSRVTIGERAAPWDDSPMTSRSDVLVRQVSSRDSAGVAALRRAWSEELAGGALDDDGFEERFSRWAAAEESRRVMFVAVVGGREVGMVNLAVFERMPRPKLARSCWCYLGNAFVLAGHRDRGVGSALLDAAVKHARVCGAVRIVLSPSERSVPFYRRAGFGPATMLMAMSIA